MARLAVEFDGNRLQRLWKKIGILTDDDDEFNFSRWSACRFHRCVVLGEPWASKFWKSDGGPAYVCPCCPMALGGHCEHEQAAHTFLRPTEMPNMAVPGAARKVGKQRKYGLPISDDQLTDPQCRPGIANTSNCDLPIGRIPSGHTSAQTRQSTPTSRNRKIAAPSRTVRREVGWLLSAIDDGPARVIRQLPAEDA